MTAIRNVTRIVIIGALIVALVWLVDHLFVGCIHNELESYREYRMRENHYFTISQIGILNDAIRLYANDHSLLPPHKNYFGPFPYGCLTTPVSYLLRAYEKDHYDVADLNTPLPVDAHGPPDRISLGSIIMRRNIRRKGSDFMYVVYGNNIWAIISRGHDGVFQFDPDIINNLNTDDERTSYILSISFPKVRPLTRSMRGDHVFWSGL
jgi:hypothetical protein